MFSEDEASKTRISEQGKIIVEDSYSFDRFMKSQTNNQITLLLTLYLFTKDSGRAIGLEDIHIAQGVFLKLVNRTSYLRASIPYLYRIRDTILSLDEEKFRELQDTTFEAFEILCYSEKGALARVHSN